MGLSPLVRHFLSERPKVNCSLGLEKTLDCEELLHRRVSMGLTEIASGVDY